MASGSLNLSLDRGSHHTIIRAELGTTGFASVRRIHTLSRSSEPRRPRPQQRIRLECGPLARQAAAGGGLP
jgi:hypothetical protein